MGGLCLNGNIHASGVLAHAENKMKLFYPDTNGLILEAAGAGKKPRTLMAKERQQRKTWEEDLGIGWTREYAVLQQHQGQQCRDEEGRALENKRGGQAGGICCTGTHRGG